MAFLSLDRLSKHFGAFVAVDSLSLDIEKGEFISLQFGADNSWQSAVTVRQPLFDPGAVVALGAAERFRRLQTEVVRGRTQVVVTRVRQLCYQVQLRTEEVRLIERSLEHRIDLLAYTGAREEIDMPVSSLRGAAP